MKLKEGRFAAATEGSRVLTRDEDGMPASILIMPREVRRYNLEWWCLDSHSQAYVERQVAERGEGHEWLIDWNHALEGKPAPEGRPEDVGAYGTWVPVVTELGLEAHIVRWFGAAYELIPNKRNGGKPRLAVLYFSPVVYGEYVRLDGREAIALRAVGPLALCNQPGTLTIAAMTSNGGKTSNTGNFARGGHMPITIEVPESIMARVPEGATPVGYFAPLGVLLAIGSALYAMGETGEPLPLTAGESEMSTQQATAVATATETAAAYTQVMSAMKAELAAVQQQIAVLEQEKLTRHVDDFIASQQRRGIFASPAEAEKQRKGIMAMSAAARKEFMAAVETLPGRVSAAPEQPVAATGPKTKGEFTALSVEDKRAFLAQPGGLKAFAALKA